LNAGAREIKLQPMMEQEKHSKKIKLTEEEYQALLAKGEELENTKKELEGLKKQLEEIKDRLLRTHADFDNAKKRLSKEKEEFVRFANEKLMRGFLPILDNFERAILHSDTSGQDRTSSVKDGIVLIQKQMAVFLAAHGLVRMEVLGKKFDPHFHEAIGHVESADHPDETIVEEIEPGYLLAGRLLRPARVRISQPKQTLIPDLPETPPEDQDQ